MNNFITKKEAMQVFRRDYLPEIREKEAKFPTLGVDKNMRRKAWVDMAKSLNKAGYISDKQLLNWRNPY
ncbi:MAG: hypothetical protein ACOCUT_00135 [bacterium]